MLSPRERVLMTCRCQQPDRVPYDISGFTKEALIRFREKTGSNSPNKYFGVESNIGGVNFKPTNLDLKRRFLKFHNLPKEKFVKSFPDFPEEGTFTLDEYGGALITGPNFSSGAIVSPSTIVNAKSIKQIEEYPLPDLIADYRHCHLEESVKIIKDRGLASYGSTVPIFENSWEIRGFNELLTDFLIREDWATYLLDRMTEFSIFQAKRYAEAGVDIIFTGDDVGMQDRMMINPALWRKWFKPRMGKIIESARKIKPDVLFFYHSDGYIEPIISDLIEIGINILNPVQPECMDPTKLKKKYGDRLAFWGTIGVQRTLPFGTPEEVKAEVKERIETVGKGGGLYLSPTHTIGSEVPYENIFAFVEAAKKYGRYR